GGLRSSGARNHIPSLKLRCWNGSGLYRLSMLRCAEEFSCGSIATCALDNSAQPCSAASAPTTRTARPTTFAYVMGIGSRRETSRSGVSMTCTIRAAPRTASRALPRHARPDTFRRAPDRPIALRGGAARTDLLPPCCARRHSGGRAGSRGRCVSLQAVRARSVLRAEGAGPAHRRDGRRAVLSRARPRAAALACRRVARAVPGTRPPLGTVRDELVGGWPSGGALSVGRNVL